MTVQQTPPPAPPIPVVPRRRAGLFDTHTLRGQFSLLALIAVVAALLALGTSLFALSQAQNRYAKVVQDTAPLLIAGQEMGQALAEIDARAAEYQLTARIDVTVPDYYVDQTKSTDAYGLRRNAWAAIQTARSDFNRALFAARANAPSSDQIAALDTTTTRFYDYLGSLQIMKEALDQGRKEEALAAYAAASNVLLTNDAERSLKANGWQGLDARTRYAGIEANIQSLVNSANADLSSAAKNANSAASLEQILLYIGLLALLAATVLAAVRYAFITHRLIHPPLALAVVGALAVAYLLVTGVGRAQTDFAKLADTTLSQINAASRVRQTGADANADESRLLLSPASSGLNSENAFITDPIRQQYDSQRLTDSFNQKVTRINSDLPVALAGATAGRAEFTDFLAQDKTLRNQFGQRFLAGAIRTYILNANPKFAAFDTQMSSYVESDKTDFDSLSCSAVGQQAFGKATCGSSGYLGTLTLVALILIPVVALLVVGGIWLRLREF